MSPQSETRLLVCLSFLVIFVVLLIQKGAEVPPGDPVAPSLPKDLEANRRLPVFPPEGNRAQRPLRQAPPLEDPGQTPKQAAGPDVPSSSPASGPEQEPKPSSDRQFDIYVVQKGDTLSRIARKFCGRSTHACIDSLVEANKDRIKGKHVIMVGQELLIPKRMLLTSQIVR